MVNITRKLVVCFVLLWCWMGSAMAQGDPQYVIRYYDTVPGNPATINRHFLAHVPSGNTFVLTDVTTFNPATCLWYSGPNIEYNYYFLEGDVYHYLSAPLDLAQELSFSATHPGTVVLNKTNQNYYFYDWDHGVARGVQHSLEDCENSTLNYNGLNENGTQCWQVVWVSYEQHEGSWRWQTSSEYGYDPTDYAARFQRVSITEHAEQVIPDATNPGGAPNLQDFAMAFGEGTHEVVGSASAFTYTHTPAYSEYVFDGNTYYFDANGASLTSAPNPTQVSNAHPISYAWELTGAGADFLSLSSTNQASTIVTYHTQNTTSSHKMATLTLTVTYEGGVTETRTATITVKTRCQNPLQAADPVVTYENVTVSWLPTADNYTIYWQKDGDSNWQSTTKDNVTSHTFTGLDYNQKYYYKVQADCGSSTTEPTTYSFTTLPEPDVVILGAVYGGGRMADVTGSPEVLMINCDSVSAVYGGNDIAGEVSGNASILLGLDADNDHNSYSYIYNGGNPSTKVRVFDVYGGGNGYYAYNGVSFTAASSDYDSQTVAPQDSVSVMTPTGVGTSAWTNKTANPVSLTFPKIKRAEIVVANDAVKIDSLFGGAKNAFLTYGDWHFDGDSIAINGGTVYAVFGGNNIGGGQGYGKHHIEVNNTKTNPTATSGHGRDFGIAYLYGGGNKVYGSTAEIFINGGQLDTIFGGGNAASVYAANLTVNCPIGAGSNANTGNDNTFGNIYSQAIYSSTASAIDSIDANYPWDGTGVYNIHTLFGGNNRAMMSVLPTITLNSGSIGTVYGGGNAGDMMSQTSSAGDEITFGDDNSLSPYDFDYSTKVVISQNHPNVLVDYLYGGCQMSNVGYSTWVQMQDGHVGTVYGGCNISGDVGSTRKDLTQPITNPGGLYQEVHGATYVEVSGGKVYHDVFAGGNGFYHCVDGDFIYTSQITYDPAGRSYVGMTVPTHNETHVVISGDALVDRNVYAGGNMAPVGFTPNFVKDSPYAYPQQVGLASVRMIGGEVKGDVYGGGRMASINGSNEVRVTGGRLGTGPNGGALYGGNDRLGKAGGISNRVLPPLYNTASDNNTPLTSWDDVEKVNTYVGVTGNPYINTVYGGGNGAYDYENGDMEYCDATDLPIQSNIFVDIAIDGGNTGGFIENVYGGGNGVYANGFIKVFLNVQNCASDTRDHVGTIFGGNNLGQMDRIPDIILLNGNVHTVYGGCNKGALVGDSTLTVNGTSYPHLGGYVHLRKEYTVTNTTLSTPVTTTTQTAAKVTGAVYGGCRMNGVTNNTLVLVDGGNHTANLFGGSDISGNVGLTSRVIVNGGTVGNVFGGGNGNYYYEGNKVYQDPEHLQLIDTIETGDITAPICAVSQVEILGGQVGASGDNNARNIYGGGWGELTETTGNVTVTIGNVDAGEDDPKPTIYGDIYGGSALGEVNTNDKTTTALANVSTSTIVNFLNGTITGNVYGGGLGDAPLNANGYINTSSSDPTIEAYVYGNVQVNIGNSAAVGNSNYVNINGSVFGGNNLAGTPKANVNVDVYRTAHTTTNTCPSTVPSALPNTADAYAIPAVYGGGNLAHYVPALSGASSSVYVHNCDNTIRYVYGGGNAANVPSSDVTIDGGMVQYVFGGGNGDGDGNPGANVNGDNTLNLNGGFMGQVFGGSNTRGTVYGETSLQFGESEANCSLRSIKELYGGGNHAADANGITLNVPCGTSDVDVIYGGANQANVGTEEVPADVVLNVRGGVLDAIYGGNNQSGTIYGKVIVNLYGGTIDKVFGGNNQGGYINDTIQVNVIDAESTTCPLNVNTIYGGGNMAAYSPTFTPASGTLRMVPQVNVIHGTINDAVYGGGMGSGATVNANPVVTIGDNNASHKAIVGANLIGTNTPGSGNVYGGGDAAAVNGSTTVVYQDTHNQSRVNCLFGGGNQASITKNDDATGATTVNMNSGKVLVGIYGGCNTKGTVEGAIAVNVNGGTLGTSSSETINIFGGGYGGFLNAANPGTSTDSIVTVTIGTNAGGNTAPVIYGNIYGGSAFGSVNNGNDDVTKVWLKSGTVNGRVYGGGLGQKAATGVTAYEAAVNGGVQVLVDDGVVTTAIYGCNDQNGAPQDTVNVTVNNGLVANVVGGGNLADYAGTPKVYINGGDVAHRVIGGGREANVGGTHIILNDGIVGSGTNNNEPSPGIFGGCNDSGTVTGDIVVDVLGGTIGTMATLEGGNTVNIHGGGYGADTRSTGDVTVNFGSDAGGEDSEHSEYPMLYGDLYGGSALGDVNTENGNDVTTVNVLNGSLKYKTVAGVLYGGNVYGGGLGDTDHPASVNGEVHVNIGNETLSGDLLGQAALQNCKVFGCNNASGSPQKDVYVDVYQTYHTPTDSVSSPERDFAIQNVFGGGNRADYEPIDALNKAYTYIHNCENTINTVYGGGNAAAAIGTQVDVDGGRFEYIFGGGNGQVSPADIGEGGINLTVCSGHVGYKYVGCDQGGNVVGTMTDHECTQNPKVCDGELEIDYFFFGANKATIIGGLVDTIYCHTGSGDDPMQYQNVYAGSRLAVIYGDIYLVVQGGVITNLFGGSQGSIDHFGDVRRFPDPENEDEMALVPSDAREDMAVYLEEHPLAKHTGGNIYMKLEGGTIHNVYGGNQLYGNVDGDIIIIVDEKGGCPLVIDTIYGGNQKALYQPTELDNGDPRVSPQVYIKNGTVNYDVFASSLGDNGQIPFITNAGKVVSSPYVLVGGDGTNDEATVGRDVFGGGSTATVEGNTKVVLRGHATVEGDVYGGSKKGNVAGTTDVQIAPTTVLPIVIPDPPQLESHTLTFFANPDAGGTVEITDNQGNEITSGDQVTESTVLHIVARPADGYHFTQWTVDHGVVTRPNHASSSFIMKTQNATLQAIFEHD